MKKVIALSILSSICLAGSLKKTAVIEYKDPTVKQLEVAKQMIDEAIALKKKGKLTQFRAKLEKAQKFQKKYKSQRIYNAAFVATLKDGTEVNYFNMNEDDIDQLRYETMVSETCFNGMVVEAAILFNHIAKNTDMINYDEEWYENARVQSRNSIKIDLVDGPNEYTTELAITRCK